MEEDDRTWICELFKTNLTASLGPIETRLGHIEKRQESQPCTSHEVSIATMNQKLDNGDRYTEMAEQRDDRKKRAQIDWYKLIFAGLGAAYIVLDKLVK